MKRIVCAALVAAAAATAAPAHAGGYGVQPYVWNDEHRVGAGLGYQVNGGGYEPLGAAYVNRDTGEVCVGFSYQVMQCAGGPIS